MDDMNLLPTLAEAAMPPMALEPLPTELQEDASTLDKLKAADHARPGFPGEHWIVLGLGVAMWQFTRKSPSWVARTVGSMLATMLVARAASGHRGLSKVLSHTPLGRGISNCPPCAEATRR